MKRYIFHVPKQVVQVCAIYAEDEADARAQLAEGACEQLYTKSGTTKSGSIELVAIQELTTGETDNEETT